VSLVPRVRDENMHSAWPRYNLEEWSDTMPPEF
jgi:hypothetical protein